MEPSKRWIKVQRNKFIASRCWKLVEAPSPQLVGCGFDSRPGYILKTWKTVLAACPALCSAFMGECKGKLHARCYDLLPVQHSLRK